MCYADIGLCAKNDGIGLGSTNNTIERAYAML